MEKIKASLPLGVKSRTVLRHCTHTPEEHIAMSTACEQCPECGGDGIRNNGEYLEDCPCRTFCCKWLTEVQIAVPWCVEHNLPGVTTRNGSVDFCDMDRDDCDISFSVVWKTVGVTGEK